MMDTETLAKTLGYHKRALLRRVTALGGLVTPYVTEGKNGGFLFGDRAIAILKRLQELERDGLSVAAAVQRIREELESEEHKGVFKDVPGALSGDPAKDELIAELRARIQEQAEIIRFLQEQLRNKEEELKALMPPKGAQGTYRSRWEALRFALLGR